MHILYIDGSGSVPNPDETHFILAGVAVFERAIYHVIEELEGVVRDFQLGDPVGIELHGSPMYNGRVDPWRRVPRGRRLEMMGQALNVLANTQSGVRAFGVVVHKGAMSPNDPVEYAFEEICNRFNLFLQRHYLRGGKKAEDRQRGLVVMDESHYEQTLQKLAREFRVTGTRWGKLRHLAEVPLFVDSSATRLVQLADLVAFALWRKYEHKDDRLFDPIIAKFDADGGVLHGLFHYRARETNCYCPACMSRQQGAHGRQRAEVP